MRTYHSKEQVIIKLSKDEYHKELKHLSFAKEELKALKEEFLKLQKKNLELVEKLKQQMDLNLSNTKEINALEHQIYNLTYPKERSKLC